MKNERPLHAGSHANNGNNGVAVATLDLSALSDLVVAKLIAAGFVQRRTPERAVLTRAELADALGCSVSKVAGLIREGCPCVRLGSDAPRFELAEVLTWLRTREVAQ